MPVKQLSLEDARVDACFESHFKDLPIEDHLLFVLTQFLGTCDRATQKAIVLALVNLYIYPKPGQEMPSREKPGDGEG